MVLSTDEQRRIVDEIGSDFTDLIAKYDSRKYPEAPYLELQGKFRAFTTVSCEDIKRALVWKYGHWRKDNYPDAHKILIQKVCQEWPQFVTASTSTPRGDFDYWSKTLQDHHSFITVCFLVHLLHTDSVAILDQNNFRAMNHLVRTVRSNWVAKKKPSNYRDLVDVGDFIQLILGYWSFMNDTHAPDKRAIDKYLMVLGQRLKKQ